MTEALIGVLAGLVLVLALTRPRGRGRWRADVDPAVLAVPAVVQRDVAAAAREGEVQAVRLLRRRLPWDIGLAAAVELVRAISGGTGVPSTWREAVQGLAARRPDLDRQLRDVVRDGRERDAVRVLARDLGIGDEAAARLVEAVQEDP